jgi:hypothetical protein
VVYVPGQYNNTAINQAGQINGNAVNNADKVAWLLATYGAAGQGDEAKALQAAIWEVIYGDNFTLSGKTKNSQNVIDLYNIYMTALGNNTGNISNFYWMSPRKIGETTIYQGLVTPVPIPAAAWLLGSGLLGLVVIRRRMKK